MLTRHSIVPPLRPALKLVSGYEGLGGYDPRTQKYYPYHCAADKAGLMTEGKGHLISARDILNNRFAHGLTLGEVEQLFSDDCAPRATRLAGLLKSWTDQQFLAAFSMYYNDEEAWSPGHTPHDRHMVGDSIGCAKGILLYINADHKPLRGLYRRRMTEALYYLTAETMIAKDVPSEHLLEIRLAREFKFSRPKVLY